MQFESFYFTNVLQNRFNVAEAQTFLFYIRFWWNFLRLKYSCVLQSHKVSSKSDQKQKFFITRTFFVNKQLTLWIIFFSEFWLQEKKKLYIKYTTIEQAKDLVGYVPYLILGSMSQWANPQNLSFKYKKILFTNSLKEAFLLGFVAKV